MGVDLKVSAASQPFTNKAKIGPNPNLHSLHRLPMMAGLGRIGAPVAPHVAFAGARGVTRPCVLARATNKAWGPGPGKLIATSGSVDELAALELDTLRGWLSDLVSEYPLFSCLSRISWPSRCIRTASGSRHRDTRPTRYEI
jgi:hypothetical protein